ncbi:MAG: YceI family protein [Bacteroidetes bacterium]|nr:YceI family protein [Bacteroidota bacterium]HET6243137.1 YceI family protein [Bacteroidia bacterium]
MKKSIIILAFSIALTIIAGFKPVAQKLVSTKSHIKFFSHTPAEDIEANNYKMVSTIDTQTGNIVFSVPMQSFEFEKSLMQKHFNNADFLDTKVHPKAKLTGKITNLKDIKFDKDGVYTAIIGGELTIKGVTKAIKEKGTITVKGSIVEVNSKFNLKLADFGITFAKGKPSTNIAETVEVTVYSAYQPE